MEKILVVGGSGFLGRSIQEYSLRKGIENKFIFSYNEHPERIHSKLVKRKIDLMDENSVIDYGDVSTIIYVAGNIDHSLALDNPLADLKLNVMCFLNLMKRFRGALILLSSQAVYYGLEEKIFEDIDHVSAMPYGISKQMVEMYAKYFFRTHFISRLWIIRLMYAFGNGERERRLIPRCAKAAALGGKVNIYGGGKSLLNPLPSMFVAEVLINAALSLSEFDEPFLEITNLNYPEKVTVMDVVKFLNDLRQFNFEILDSGEEWPVIFWGDTNKLSAYLNKWGISFPDIWDSLRVYFLGLYGGGNR